MANNPYSNAFAAINQALLKWPSFMALIRPNNLVLGQAPSYETRTNIQSGDLAMVELTEKRLGIDPLTWNSKAVQFRALYYLAVDPGSSGPDKINLLVIESARALLNATDPRTGRLNGADPSFYKWEIKPDMALSYKSVRTGRKEWSTVAPILAYFGMGRDDFMAAAFS